MDSKQISDNVFRLSDRYSSGYKKEIIWAEDIHFDSQDCDRKKLKYLFDRFPESDIILGGDFFDLMQGTGDPRASKAALKEQYARDDYVDSIVEDAVKFFAHYRDRILLIFQGNHELSFKKRHGIDVTKYFVKSLGGKALQGQFANWIDFRFEHEAGGAVIIKKLYHSHAGSLGRRSKAVLAADLLAADFPQADMYVVGHSHQPAVIPTATEGLTPSKKLKYTINWYVQSPSMKDSQKQGNSFEKQRRHQPKFTGVAVLTFEFRNKKMITNARIECE